MRNYLTSRVGLYSRRPHFLINDQVQGNTSELHRDGRWTSLINELNEALSCSLPADLRFSVWELKAAAL